MNKKEVFKDIKGFEGIYQVSNLGRVKSLKFNKEKILKAGDSNGYCTVDLWKNKKRYSKHVHKLVAMAFLDHEPNGYKLVVDHVNNVRTDNRVENLQIITPRKNTSKDRKKGTSKYIGVYWSKHASKWHSQIQINGKRKYLGLFTDEYEAHLSYQNELKNITK
jgi:hypothetical protein